MRLNAHFDMLPERAFQKRGFGGAPATLEGGKGGGSAAPSVTKSETSNIPEYAKPYVMNMLGAAQNQLFDTAAGGTDIWGNPTPGAITGFKPYQPYSTNPQDYFAGPSSLQTSAYNAAGQLRSPVQYQTGSQLATQAGLGQLGTVGQAGMYGQQGANIGQLGLMGAMPAFGAGQQYAGQVTSPGAVSSYMSPYQQAVTDVAKNAAIREAQLADQQVNLGAARQGTYGGARQALAKAERERNLLSNLSNIQAQGSQSAYDRAIQNMQYGANLGLQGIQTGLQGIGQGLAGTAQGLQGVGAQQAGYAGAGQAGATLGQLGSAQNAADIANINLQNQLGSQQQQYQQNIINQAIQDYATAQQYPYMQLSMMSNLLRGLPMQSMTTQSYQAQPSTTQQALGLLGTGASLYGAMKREGGTIKEYAGGGVIDSLKSKIDDIADAGGVKGLQRLLGETQSPEAKKLINERIREMGIAGASTGQLGTNMAGGGIIAFDDGGPAWDELEKYSRGEGGWRGPLDVLGDVYNPKRKDPFTGEAVSPAEYERRVAARRAYDFDKDTAAYQKSKEDLGELPTTAPETSTASTSSKTSAAPTAPASAASQYSQPSGLAAVLAERQKLLGVDGPGEKSQALMKALEERQAGLSGQADSDRYLRMAEAFAKFGSTAGPIGVAASEALGGFAKGEATARKEQDKMRVEGMKMQSDLEKAQRAEARGDLDAAEKFYNSAEDRKNRIETAQISASAAGQTARFDKEAIQRIMDEKGVDFATAAGIWKGAGKSEGLEVQIATKAYAAAQSSVAPGGANAKTYKELLKKDPTGAEAERFVDELAQKQIQGMRKTMGLGGGATGGGSGKVIDFNAIK